MFVWFAIASIAALMLVIRLAMTVGATLPIFLMPRISFTATRRTSGCRFL